MVGSFPSPFVRNEFSGKLDVLLNAARILSLFNSPAHLVKSPGVAIRSAPEMNHEDYHLLISDHPMEHGKVFNDVLERGI